MKIKDSKKVLARAIRQRRNVLISGMPGVGKSDLVDQAAADAGADTLTIHCVSALPEDAKGLPNFVQDPTTCEVTHAQWFPYGDLHRMMEATKTLVVHLEDFGQAMPSVQASFMQLLLARRSNGFKISDHVVFVASTNRRQDKAGVSTILTPVQSRFPVRFELDADVQEWRQWAMKRDDIHPLVIGFASWVESNGEPLFRFNPSKDLEGYCVPRTLTFEGQRLKDYEQELDAPELFELAAGNLGEAAATKLIGFIQVHKELPNPEEVIRNPDKFTVPERPDVLYALNGAIAMRCTVGNIDDVMRWVNKLPAEYAVATVKDFLSRDKSLAGTSAFTQFAKDNEEVIFPTDM